MGGGRRGGVEINSRILDFEFFGFCLFVFCLFYVNVLSVFVIMCSLFLCVLAFVFVMLRCGWGQQRRS